VLFWHSDLHRIAVPLLVMHGADDLVTDPKGSRALYEKASSVDKSLKQSSSMEDLWRTYRRKTPRLRTVKTRSGRPRSKGERVTAEGCSESAARNGSTEPPVPAKMNPHCTSLASRNPRWPLHRLAHLWPGRDQVAATS
jgi:hypothetical protein